MYIRRRVIKNKEDFSPESRAYICLILLSSFVLHTRVCKSSSSKSLLSEDESKGHILNKCGNSLLISRTNCWSS